VEGALEDFEWAIVEGRRRRGFDIKEKVGLLLNLAQEK